MTHRLQDTRHRHPQSTANVAEGNTTSAWGKCVRGAGDGGSGGGGMRERYGGNHVPASHLRPSLRSARVGLSARVGMSPLWRQ